MLNVLSSFAHICGCELPHIAFDRFELDSRCIDERKVFIALKGAQVDGRHFIDKAIAAKAVAVLSQAESLEQHGQVEWRGNTCIIHIDQLDTLQGALANLSAQDVIKSMQFIGVTGTNGKTSVAHLIQQMWGYLQKRSAYIGTLGVRSVSSDAPLNNTTPVAIELFNILADLAEQAHTHCVLEVSSHALIEKRLYNLRCAVTAFTNLSHDHLDFHGDMACYYQAKKLLFTDYATQHAIINVDDSYGLKLYDELATSQPEGLKTKIAVGLSDAVQNYPYFIHGRVISLNNQGCSFELTAQLNQIHQSHVIHIPLIGEFNVSNALIAFACLLVEGYSFDQLIAALMSVKPIDGRMELYKTHDTPTIVVDFAHTPDGLTKALQAARQHCNGNVWLVFGCGGDRDSEKRTVMGALAQHYADATIITNDNPRNEDPRSIASAILAGYNSSGTGQVSIILDRKKAIQYALNNAAPEDMILVAGKGHETTQEIAGIKHAYNEREYVQNLMKEAA